MLKPDAISLNVRVDFAHVGVSIEGKMLKMTRLPLMSELPTSLKLPAVNANFGRRDPTFGRFPLMETLLPPRVTDVFAATFFFATCFFTIFFVAFLVDFLVAFLIFFFCSHGVLLGRCGYLSLSSVDELGKILQLFILVVDPYALTESWTARTMPSPHTTDIFLCN